MVQTVKDNKPFFTKEEIKRWIDQGKSIKLLVGQAITHSNPSSKIN